MFVVTGRRNTKVKSKNKKFKRKTKKQQSCRSRTWRYSKVKKSCFIEICQEFCCWWMSFGYETAKITHTHELERICLFCFEKFCFSSKKQRIGNVCKWNSLRKGSSQRNPLFSSIFCWPSRYLSIIWQTLRGFEQILKINLLWNFSFFQIEQNDLQNYVKSSQSQSDFRGLAENTAIKWVNLRWPLPLSNYISNSLSFYLFIYLKSFTYVSIINQTDD